MKWQFDPRKTVAQNFADSMNHDFDARNALIDRAVRDVSTRAQRDHFSRMASLNPLADVETCWPTMVPAIRRRFAQLVAIENMHRMANAKAGEVVEIIGPVTPAMQGHG